MVLPGSLPRFIIPLTCCLLSFSVAAEVVSGQGSIVLAGEERSLEGNCSIGGIVDSEPPSGDLFAWDRFSLNFSAEWEPAIAWGSSLGLTITGAVPNKFFVLRIGGAGAPMKGKLTAAQVLEKQPTEDGGLAKTRLSGAFEEAAESFEVIVWCEYYI